MVPQAIKRTMRLLSATAIAVATAMAAFGAVGAGYAPAAEAPRWIVKAVPTPTHVQANTPRNEVQKLTVIATGGTFTLDVLPLGTGTIYTSESIPHNATAAEVKAVLAKLPNVGNSGVSVTGGPGTGTPNEYTVTFQGGQGNAPVALMVANTAGLTGGTATVTELTKGALPSQIVVTATNVGGAATNGGTITLSDVLPSWLTATHVEGVDVWAAYFYGTQFGAFQGGMSCSSPPAVSCTYSGKVDPGDQLYMVIEVDGGAGPAGGAVNQARVEGGGAAPVTFETGLEPNGTPAAQGVAPGSVFAAVSTSQAGAHPNVVTSFWLNTSETDRVSGTPKDVRFDLPPGLVGSTVGMPRCNMTAIIEGGFGTPCPRDTMVGVSVVELAQNENGAYGQYVIPVPVYNIAPAPGEPAAFGFDAFALPVRLDTSVLSNGDYGVRVTAGDLAQSAIAIGGTVTIWGVPAEHSGPGSNGEFVFANPHTLGGVNEGQTPTPLLTNPQQCQIGLNATMSADTWNKPGLFESAPAPMGTLTGCLQVPFESSFSFLPDTLEAGAPAGYRFDLHVNQRNTAGTLATSSVKEVHLTLPEGVVVNPSAAWGLKACSTDQFYGPNHPSQGPAEVSNCPREAKVGEVEVESPDLQYPLKGDVLLGSPECDPCAPSQAEDGEMVRLFIQLQGEGESGIVVKLEGHALIDQGTGRITAVFKETPQLPFSRMRFVLEGGPRAVLANPRKCGTVKASGDLRPWSILEAPGEAELVSDSMPFYEFEINQNCFGPQFEPSFVAGSPNIQSGAYTPFTLSFGRGDDDEFLSGIKQTMPAGLLGNLSGIPLCKEPESAQGTCGAGSLIGHVQVLTGPGANPFLVSGGQVFLTEGYEGAPYGLSIVVPAVAGPYTLSGTTGKGTVVVRAKIQVDPITAALTVTSDPLPTVLDGIPLQLKAVNVTIDRPDFTFNPTSCAKKAIGGLLSSSEGMTASKTSSFQVTNCAGLGFKPGFKVTTNGKTSRANGASLKVKLTYPKATFGSQANISKVKVDLPKQMPSRLSTLQKACTAKTFESNPAACPAASKVGFATASTPIIPVPLTGPAYFVSYGGAKFPELVIVLSGYGVTVDLHGETFINEHTNVTSSTFRTVPDVPIGSFELTLPQGPNSALAATANLCTSMLKMPTAFTAQNGMVIKRSTPITPTGCPKHKARKHKSKREKGKK